MFVKTTMKWLSATWTRAAKGGLISLFNRISDYLIIYLSLNWETGICHDLILVKFELDILCKIVDKNCRVTLHTLTINVPGEPQSGGIRRMGAWRLLYVYCAENSADVNEARYPNTYCQSDTIKANAGCFTVVSAITECWHTKFRHTKFRHVRYV